ncbi:phycobilisome protein [Hydrococcus rivularis NIES-593]|uniref:Phycobilisome protein n=1 Tax=Hydrococcus rivularis NIES-593 TaxID=1921803 RepID=A0A1U7HBU2_9CYAN|nr:phycobilisome protein [Hydrococcus rivularis]OKH21057.1 phycobilisome protein [Hydrococcus rivularis NIES-593]
MHTDFEALFQQAEDRYLQRMEINAFNLQVSSLAKRLETYKSLRDQEVVVFQPVADKLLETFPNENSKTLERALKHWLSVMRYCAMAMLLNNPEYLERRLLEWLTDIIKAHQMEAIEKHLYESLIFSLRQELPAEQFVLIQPFLAQAYKTLVGEASVEANTNN